GGDRQVLAVLVHAQRPLLGAEHGLEGEVGVLRGGRRPGGGVEDAVGVRFGGGLPEAGGPGVAATGGSQRLAIDPALHGAARCMDAAAGRLGRGAGQRLTWCGGLGRGAGEGAPWRRRYPRADAGVVAALRTPRAHGGVVAALRTARAHGCVVAALHLEPVHGGHASIWCVVWCAASTRRPGEPGLRRGTMASTISCAAWPRAPACSAGR